MNKMVRTILRMFITVSSAVLIVVTILLTEAQAQMPKLNSNSASPATVFLDFDGQFVTGTAWNWDSSIHALPSTLTPQMITEVFNRVAEDFRIFNLNITTDPGMFDKAPVAKRTRIIITPTSEWYGEAGGISFVNSFVWGDDTPAWVFTNMLEENSKYIAEATSHEIGHTLGLQHQSTYTGNCELVNEYAEGKGSGEIGWAPIMGVGYYKNLTLWTFGSSIEGCSVKQNDITIIASGLNDIGFRPDDHGNSKQTASNITVANDRFKSTGIINNAADKDYFKLKIDVRSRLQTVVFPYSVAEKNSGANIDIGVTLFSSTGEVLRTFNPRTLLNASIDTILSAGTYYFEVDGTGNQNISDYGSTGLYSMAGSVETLPAEPSVVLHGSVLNKFNVLKWNKLSYSGPQTRYLEYSLDGKKFTTLTTIVPSIQEFTHHLPATTTTFYRVRIISGEESSYSNVVALNSSEAITIEGTIVSHSIQLRSADVFSYTVVDETGRLLARGRLNAGLTQIPVNRFKAGLLVLNCFNEKEQHHFRLMKR
jgi:hypothetical protein